MYEVVNTHTRTHRHTTTSFWCQTHKISSLGDIGHISLKTFFPIWTFSRVSCTEFNNMKGAEELQKTHVRARTKQLLIGTNERHHVAFRLAKKLQHHPKRLQWWLWWWQWWQWGDANVHVGGDTNDVVFWSSSAPSCVLLFKSSAWNSDKWPNEEKKVITEIWPISLRLLILCV